MSHEHQARLQAYNPLTWPAGAVDTPCIPLPAARCGAYSEATGPSTRGELVSRLGANALGEVLVPGRVPDCYLGLRLDPASGTGAAGVLVVAPAVLLDPVVPQPDGTVLYELVTGHPDRTPEELVFLADLAVELRAWPADTWSKVGVDPQAVAGAVVAGWRRGPLTAQEALALERPAMTYVRAQIGDRLQGQLAWASRRR
jgi:hypothetical protein